MLFGPLGKCPLCGSHMEYKEGHYCCRGFLSEWTKCTHTSGEALRLKAQWKLPEDNDNEYLDEVCRLRLSFSSLSLRGSLFLFAVG